MNDLIKEPVQKKLFLLILIFSTAFTVVISTEIYLRHFLSQYVSCIINQRSRSTLGKIIINKLIQIEKDFCKVALEINLRDMHIIEKHIFSSISDIEIILGILQNGGEYENVMPANLAGIDEIKEAISFAVDKGQGYMLEIINLTPKILDIRRNAFDLIETKKMSLSARNEKERLSAASSFIIILKQTNTLLQRGRENATRIFYDTNRKIQRLEQKLKQSTQLFVKVRIAVIVVVCIISFAFFFLISRRIRDIFRERKRVELALQRAHDELELRIEERTTELSETNKNLKRGITERKQAEDQIKASLKEKEVLLKEIHHRVKNNLQVISSLLSLQSQHITDKESLEMFQESQNRVWSMSLVHEKLYQSKDLSRIDMKEYTKDLTTSLFRSYADSTAAIKLKTKIGDLLLTITTAIPYGLIINELISNALKHGFPDGRQGDITIAMHPVNNKIKLVVSDTGVGFPEGIDFRNTTTLGMQLVTSLVEQLEGTIELDRRDGSTFTICFEELTYKKRV